MRAARRGGERGGLRLRTATAANVLGVGTNESAANCADKPGPAATVMIFTFPDDFERLARKSRRSSDWKLASPPSQRRS